jgi:peptidoglycan hydrolase-like protein with peptidoglycan-binding domain
MAWRLAKSLEQLRTQINQHWPHRSKKSDGSIGDSAHSKTQSDHNTNPKGVVTAIDITSDKANGPNLIKLIPLLLKDKRTKYIIFNRKIYNPSIQNGKSRPYTGANPHDKHMHISASSDPAMYDRTFPWAIDPISAPIVEAEQKPLEVVKPVLKKGQKGGDVQGLQYRLKELGDYNGLIDSDFGPKTEAAVKSLQARTGLKADGVVGPQTWAKLAVAPPVAVEQTVNVHPPIKNAPEWAIAYFESLGWSRVQAVALVANLIWESGGSRTPPKPHTIVFEAKGDRDKNGAYQSFGAGQWNTRAGRFGLLEDFAEGYGKPWTDGEVQLNTTERKAGTALRMAVGIEEAVAAAIKIWRPSIPHADRRLAIAKSLLK